MIINRKNIIMSFILIGILNLVACDNVVSTNIKENATTVVESTILSDTTITNAEDDKEIGNINIITNKLDYLDEDTNVLLIKGSYDVIEVDENFKKNYSSIVDKINKINEEGRLLVTNFINGYKNEAKQTMIDRNSTDFCFELERNIFPVNINDKIFSFNISCYQYIGGAHGGTVLITNNFDITTGKELTIDDIVVDKNLFYDAIHDKLVEKYQAQLFEDPKSGLEIYRNGESNLTFAYDKEGIIVYFGQYELAPYSSGILEVCIPYSDNVKRMNQ